MRLLDIENDFKDNYTDIFNDPDNWNSIEHDLMEKLKKIIVIVCLNLFLLIAEKVLKIDESELRKGTWIFYQSVKVLYFIGQGVLLLMSLGYIQL